MILAILSTAIVYLVLQRLDDNKKIKQNQPVSSWPSRIGLLFFVAIVCFIASYFIENMGSDKDNKSAYVDGGKYEDAMIKNIQEPIHTGLPPF